MDHAEIRCEELERELRECRRELEHALSREAASSKILRLLISPVTATQPVFDSIVQSCLALYSGCLVGLLLVRDGWIEPQAWADATDSEAPFVKPFPVDQHSAVGSCFLESRVVHVPDAKSAVEQFPRMKESPLWGLGFESRLCVPLIRDGRAVGVISIFRRAVGPFSDREIALIQTFADQAVIAIENVRLFQELQSKNAELTESLEQQTATSEILRVISSSPTDTQPVFDAIVEGGSRLLGEVDVVLRLVKDNQLSTAARSRGSRRVVDGDIFTTTLSDDSAVGRSILRREVVDVPDNLTESWISERAKQRSKLIGRRAATVEIGRASCRERV